MQKYFWLLVAVCISITACKKRDVAAPEPQLPPYTDTGAHTMGAIVNGKVLVPYSKGLRIPVRFAYQGFTMERKGFSLFFWNDKTNERMYFDGEFLREESKEIQEKTYPIGFYNNDMLEENGQFMKLDTILVRYYNKGGFDGDFVCYPERGYRGELTIKKIDRAKQILSGTFWFNAVDPNGEVVEVKDGRFDVQYAL